MIGAARLRQGSLPAAGGAVAFDAATDGDHLVAATSSTFAHTCTGSDRCLYVFVGSYHSTVSNSLPSGVTYNSVAMTRIANHLHGNASKERITVWRLIAPATGSNNVVVTMPATSEINDFAVSYTGVHQTTSETDVQTGNFNSSTASLTITSAVDSIVCGITQCYNKTVTIGAGQTQRAYHIGGTTTETEMVSDEAGAASVTHSYTFSAATWWGEVAFSIDPA